MTRQQIIVDCETTSLIPDYETGSGVIWELAFIDWGTYRGTERLWRMRPDLSAADPEALSVSRYCERTGYMCPDCTPRGICDLTQATTEPEWSEPKALAGAVARILDGATLVAANPSFDAGFLTAFLRHYGQTPTWHYRLRDIGSMAWGYLSARHEEGRFPGVLPPVDASTDDFALALGVNAAFERHSALGDCRLVAAMLDVIEGGAS